MAKGVVTERAGPTQDLGDAYFTSSLDGANTY